MTSKALSTGLRGVTSVQRILFTGSAHSAVSKVSAANISGKSSRVEPLQKAKPWDYRKWGYTNMMAFMDSTLKRMNENSKVVVVEGPPGIGKSALARALAEELEMKYFPMVTADSYYINTYGYDLRQLDSQLPASLKSYDESAFLKNPKSSKAIHLQFVLWLMKYRQYTDALAHLFNTGEGVVLDRSVYSVDVFTDTMVDAGFITKEEREVFQKVQDRVMKKLLKPHLIVYLDAPASVVEANLKKRGKGEEKVWTKELLEKLDQKYKHDYLKTITQHAELVAYDWSTPGEAEVVVEDIERIDFDRFDIHDPKMEDWRLKESEDWNMRRWLYTQDYARTILKVLNNGITWKIPALSLSAEQQFALQDVFEKNKVPGTQYQTGYNINDGDSNILWSTKPFVHRDWVDYDLPKAKV